MLPASEIVVMDETNMDVDGIISIAPKVSPILMAMSSPPLRQGSPIVYLFRDKFGEQTPPGSRSPIVRGPLPAANPHSRHDSLTDLSDSNNWHTQVSIQQAQIEGINLDRLDELPVTHWRSTAHLKELKESQRRISQDRFYNLESYYYDRDGSPDASPQRELVKYESIVAPDPELELIESRTLHTYENLDEEMADVDDRTDAPRRNGGYNNGGGHNRHGGGRRYNNNNYNNNNGYQDGGNRGRKRGRGEMGKLMAETRSSRVCNRN